MGKEFDFLLQRWPNRLKEQREGKGLSQRGLAKMLSMSKMTIYRIESQAQGRNTASSDTRKDSGRMNNRVAEAIAEALGVRPQEIFGDYERARQRTPQLVRLFSCREERDAAIEEALPEIIKYIPKMHRCFNNKLSYQDVEDIAYDTLINLADRALTRGLPEDRPVFLWYVMRAIRTNCYEWIRQKNRTPIHFEGQQTEDGEQMDIYPHDKRRELRQGNIENTPQSLLARREGYQELVTELKHMKHLMEKYGI